MKKIKEVIVVEGKTDTAIIKKLFDADTIETHGLAMDEKILDLIEQAHEKRGIIVLTDPDYPGMQIRNRIMQRVPHAKHAFVDKKDAIGEKKLGIAEAREDAIIEALENVVSFLDSQETLSWEEFISLDIIGDKKRRLEIYDLFHLGYGNAKTLYKRLNLAQITKQDILDKLNEESYMIKDITLKMIEYNKGDPKRINHFLKVHQFAKVIGSQEQLDKDTQYILEIAALTHDIGIKVSEQKYGSSAGHYQEKEGPSIAQEMLKSLGIEDPVIERVCYLIGHHHTYQNIDHMDHQILVEADFLVNLYEDKSSLETIQHVKDKIFKTSSGTYLLECLFEGK